MSDVVLHRNSAKPAQLNALAYAQGNEIHLGPGQEKHLPHEAWHVVQQRQGRVRSTTRTNIGVDVNDDNALEAEADKMGEQAAGFDGGNDVFAGTHSGPATALGAMQLKTISKDDRRLPGGYAKLVQTEEWHKEAVAFETRLGSYASRDGRSNDAVKKGLKKMADTFRIAYGGDITKKNNYLSPFGIDDPREEKTSAGQVAKSGDVDAIREVVEEKTKRWFLMQYFMGDASVTDVNLRERMTAFYNAAYFGKGVGGYQDIKPSLKKILHEIVLGQSDELSSKLNIADKMELARHLGLDVRELGSLAGYMRGAYRRTMDAGMRAVSTLGLAENNFLFAEDVFGVGNLANDSLRNLWNNAEMPRSHAAKEKRSDAQMLAHAKTPADYSTMGVGLSSRERSFVNKNRAAGGLTAITGAEKLPWREGIAYYFVNPESDWGKLMAMQGFPVVSAISGTTARMISVYKWLNLGSGELLNFRLAIMGWMLTSRDHSLYEILRGAEMVGVKGATEDTSDAVLMYLHIEPLTEDELRSNVGKDRMFPHESAYVELASKKVESSVAAEKHGGLLLPGTAAVDVAKANAAAGAQGLNVSHLVALRAYTGPDHHVLNAILQWYESSYGIDYLAPISSTKKVENDLYEHISKRLKKEPAECPVVIGELFNSHPSWKPIKDVFDDPLSSQQHKASALDHLRANCQVLAPKLKEEAAIHVNMLDEALNLLPPFGGTVYMGTWELYGAHTGAGISTKSFEYYQSTSKKEGKALEFAKGHKGYTYKIPVLYKIKLRPDGHGRDISSFSVYPGEQEVLLVPPAHISVKPRTEVKDGISRHEADEL